MGAWVTEQSHVSSPVHQSVSTSINAFHNTWSTSRQQLRPDLGLATCNRLIALSVEVVEDIVRIRHLHRVTPNTFGHKDSSSYQEPKLSTTSVSVRPS